MEHRADHARELVCIDPANAIALTSVHDHKGHCLWLDGVHDGGVVRAHNGSHDDPSFGEQIAGDVAHGSHQPRPPPGAPPLAVVPVVVDEEADAFVVVEVQVHGRSKVAGLPSRVLNFYVYRATDVDLLSRTTAGGDNPDASQTGHVIAGCACRVGPLTRARSPRTRLQVAPDHLVGRAINYDPAVIEQDGSIAQPQDRRHAVRDEDNRPASLADL